MNQFEGTVTLDEAVIEVNEITEAFNQRLASVGGPDTDNGLKMKVAQCIATGLIYERWISQQTPEVRELTNAFIRESVLLIRKG